jgi:hypothetical protein
MLGSRANLRANGRFREPIYREVLSDPKMRRVQSQSGLLNEGPHLKRSALHHGYRLVPWSTRFAEPIKLPDMSAYGCPRSGTGQNDHQRNEERRLNR